MQILFCVSIRKIKRIIFLEIQKLTRDENGDLNYSLIPTHQAKQIAGRAGRYGSGENVGLVTAHTEKKMIELKEIIQQDLEDIQVKTNREITAQINNINDLFLTKLASRLKSLRYFHQLWPLCCLLHVFSKQSSLTSSDIYQLTKFNIISCFK